MNKETAKAIIRLLVTLILTINSILTANGKNPIPFDESAFTETATYILNFLSAAWVWWKNNNVTKAAQHAQKVLNDEKALNSVNKTK